MCVDLIWLSESTQNPFYYVETTTNWTGVIIHSFSKKIISVSVCMYNMFCKCVLVCVLRLSKSKCGHFISHLRWIVKWKVKTRLLL